MRIRMSYVAILMLAGGMYFSQAVAQSTNFCAAHAGTLYCKIPSIFGSPVVNPLQPLDGALATQLTLVPLASPASGIVYQKSPSNKLPIPSGTETFGPVLTERGETLYSGKLFVAAVYQRFRFNSLDGVNLKQIPFLFSFCNDLGQCGPIAVIVRTDVHLDQYALFATYGVTQWLDVSAALPILKVTLGVNGVRCVPGLCEYTPPGSAPIMYQNNFVADSSAGIGDVVLRAKAGIFETRKFKFAAGADVRLPSGDALNFLGSGSTGVKPFEAWSRSGRISPHLNAAYQWNAKSQLAGAIQGQKGSLPEVLSYALGVDAGAIRTLTVSADFLGEHVISSPRLVRVTTHVSTSVSTQDVVNAIASSGTYNTARGAIGFKWNPAKDLLVSGNVLVKFDHNGLHHTAVPLVGVSYTF